MKYSLLTFAAFVAVSFTSCANDPDVVDYDEVELEILDAWMEEQIASGDSKFDGFVRSDEEYWYRIDYAGDPDGELTSEMTTGWVRYNFTGYDLEDNMCVTRNELLAYQANTFSNDVRYIPLIQEMFPSDDAYDLMPDCVELPFLDEDLALRVGSIITLYIPSSLIGNAATENEGFTGQYELTGGRPMRGVIEIVEIVEDGETWENAKAEAFAKNNGGIFFQYEEDEEFFTDMSDDELEEYVENSNITKEEYSLPWSQAIDSINYLYIYRNYTPQVKFNYTDTYTSEVPTSTYNKYTMDELDALIQEILEEKFDDTTLEGERIGEDGYVAIWYIGRYLDGFIFDTNIDEITELITGEAVESSSYATYYTPDEDFDDYVVSWYYSIPQLRFGQWATIITTSPFAYGTYPEDSTIQPYSPMIFQIYIEPEDD